MHDLPLLYHIVYRHRFQFVDQVVLLASLRRRKIMHRRILAAVLCLLLINLACYAQTSTAVAKDDKEADKIYSTVFRLGVNGSRPVKVTMRDGIELIGYIREINNNDFVLVAEGNSSVNRLAYGQVKNVKPYKSKSRRAGSVLGYSLFFGMIVAMFYGYMQKE
jgi:hypothetical protein